MEDPIFRRTAVSSGVVAILLLFGFHSRAQYAGTNGIFAEFNTSMGSYTCRLEYVLAPKACANFIGLATGQRSWLDLPSGVVKTDPFYDGTTFHRVIAGFMNQGGSQNGQGTDGPGYSFVDEFSPSLRHDGFGVLAMANSGPDSNGSQYFITVSAQPQLNDIHSVFGRLYGGSNVVYAINHVATGANDKPLASVVVNRITIQRIGTPALAFDINAQGLPLVTNLNAKIAKTGANVSLTFSNRLYADNRLYVSSNLTSWSPSGLGIEIASPVTNDVYWAISSANQFFRMAQVLYPASLFVPRTVLSRTMTLNFGGGNTIVVGFDASGGGSYTWTLGASGSILFYNWVQDPYRGRLLPIIYSGIFPMTLHLDYDTITAGTFKGTLMPNYPSTIGSSALSGTFTSSP